MRPQTFRLEDRPMQRMQMRSVQPVANARLPPAVLLAPRLVLAGHHPMNKPSAAPACMAPPRANSNKELPAQRQTAARAAPLRAFVAGFVGQVAARRLPKLGAGSLPGNGVRATFRAHLLRAYTHAHTERSHRCKPRNAESRAHRQSRSPHRDWAPQFQHCSHDARRTRQYSGRQRRPTTQARPRRGDRGGHARTHWSSRACQCATGPCSPQFPPAPQAVHHD